MKLYAVDSFGNSIMLDLQYLRGWSVVPSAASGNPDEYLFRLYLDSVYASLYLPKADAQEIKDQLIRREPKIWVECRHISLKPVVIVNA